MSIYQQPVEIPWNINSSPLTTVAHRPLSTTRKNGRPIFAQATIKGIPTVCRSAPEHPQRLSRRVAGVTLIELIIAMAILSILMSGILPLSYMAYKRSREIELRQNLRIVRTALDEYKKKVDEGRIPKENDDSGYPPELAVLVAGVESTDAVPVIFKFLRRIPRDPMTEDGEWGLRAYADEPDSNIWGGQDVYDVYSQSDEQALDGTYYRDW